MDVRRWRIFLVVALLAGSQQLPAQNVAFRRAATLRHGINLSGWFAGSGDLSLQHLKTYTTISDLKAIQAMGFDFVRLGVDPSLIERHGETAVANPAALSQLDSAVRGALANHLAVLVCVFPDDAYKGGLATERGVDDFVELWRILANSGRALRGVRPGSYLL